MKDNCELPPFFFFTSNILFSGDKFTIRIVRTLSKLYYTIWKDIKCSIANNSTVLNLALILKNALTLMMGI